jgi:hypothetical protein
MESSSPNTEAKPRCSTTTNASIHESQTSDVDVFPEGGVQAWLTVAGAAACLFVSFGWVNCVGIFQEYYQTHQLKHYSASEIAWIPSLQSESIQDSPR